MATTLPPTARPPSGRRRASLSLADALHALAPARLRDPERLPVHEAIGAVLAENLVVARDVPEAPVALRSGWAVRAEETAGASAHTPVPLATRPDPVEAGGVLGGGRNAILPKEAIPGGVDAEEGASPGLWVRAAGEDAPAGLLLAEAGTHVTAALAAASEAAGIAACAVRRPRLALMADAATPVATLVTGLAGRAGIALALGSPADLSDPGADLALAIADPGSAPEPHLAAAGSVLVAERLALRPGEWTHLLAGLPGPVLMPQPRLEAVLALWLALILPTLRAAAGARGPALRPGALTRKVVSTVGVTDLVLLRIVSGGYEPLATAEWSLAAIAAADAWVAVPPEDEGWAPGFVVPAEIL